MTQQHDSNHENLGRSIDTNGFSHVFGGEGTAVGAYVGLIEEFAEIVVWTTKAAIEDGGEGGFWVAAVGRGVVAAVFADELKSVQTPSDSP